MKRLVTFIILLSAAIFHINAEDVKEYFSVGNPISYCGEDFYLAWSSHPVDTYYLQEYLPAGETLEHYNRMLSVSILFGGMAPEEAVRAKIAELEKRKKTDRVTNYQVAEKNGEYMLEFIVSDGDEDGLDCVETDVHYYRQMTLDGKTASVLTSISTRAYDDDILPFIKSIPERRVDWYEGLLNLNLQPKLSDK